MPSAAVLVSLFGGDLKNFNGDSYETNKSKDPSNSIDGIRKFGQLYLGSTALAPSIEGDFSLGRTGTTVK